MKNQRIIAIDGPAGSGKSTVARLLSQQIDMRYLDSGAIYRTLTLYGLNTFNQRVKGHESEIAAFFESQPEALKISYDNLKQTMWLSGQNVSELIRSQEVTGQLKYVPDHPDCRAVINRVIRNLAKKYSIVIDGRDIGTIVFPDTPHKFYLDADPVTRARRRALEMEIAATGDEFNQLLESIKKRDRDDMARTIAPLRKAEDAEYIDTTEMTVDEVLSRIKEKLEF